MNLRMQKNKVIPFYYFWLISLNQRAQLNIISTSFQDISYYGFLSIQKNGFRFENIICFYIIFY